MCAAPVRVSGLCELDPLRRQHCLVRSIQLEHAPAAWANLAVTYAKHQRPDLAREAFTVMALSFIL
jgi:hypothetical protein